MHTYRSVPCLLDDDVVSRRFSHVATAPRDVINKVTSRNSGFLAHRKKRCRSQFAPAVSGQPAPLARQRCFSSSVVTSLPVEFPLPGRASRRRDHEHVYEGEVDFQ